jgi:hypothetical protein
MKKAISRATRLGILGGMLGILGWSSSANASGITLAVIFPHEYALPVNFDNSFNAVVQYGYYQTDNMAFSNGGGKVNGPNSTTAVGLTKYVRFFNFKGLPDVGFAWEIIQPAISVQASSTVLKPGSSATGFGDPITGFATWFKPSKDSTLGIQSFLQVPVGTEKVSDNSWKNLTSFIGDVQLGDFNICGDVGFVVQSDKIQSGLPDVSPGALFHTNMRFAYRVNKYFEPLIAWDYQATGSTSASNSGLTIPNSASNEMTLGGGATVYFNDSIFLSARYDYAVAGKNTILTNALYFKFAYIW